MLKSFEAKYSKSHNRLQFKTNMKRFECLNFFTIVTFIPVEAIKAGRPVVAASAHEITFVCLMASVQHQGYMGHNTVCYCGVLLDFVNQSLKMERLFFRMNSSEHLILHSRLDGKTGSLLVGYVQQNYHCS